MKSKLDITFTLTLDVREAMWVKGLVQNHGDGFSDNDQEKLIRKNIFDSLPSFEDFEQFHELQSKCGRL